jgi:hypothetical protein
MQISPCSKAGVKTWKVMEEKKGGRVEFWADWRDLVDTLTLVDTTSA